MQLPTLHKKLKSWTFCCQYSIRFTRRFSSAFGVISLFFTTTSQVLDSITLKFTGFGVRETFHPNWLEGTKFAVCWSPAAWHLQFLLCNRSAYDECRVSHKSESKFRKCSEEKISRHHSAWKTRRREISQSSKIFPPLYFDRSSRLDVPAKIIAFSEK